MTSEVFNEDNLLGMARYPDKFFDLAVVDPQYGINATSMPMGAGAPSPGGRTSVAVKSRLQRLNGGGGKLKNRLLNTSKIDWDDVPPPDEYWQELFRVSKQQVIWGGNYFDLGPTRCVLCWDKEQPWENFSQWEMAWTSFDHPAMIFRFRAVDVARETDKIHPTQKPVQLYREVLARLAFGKDGTKLYSKILDTHMGSQTSRIAAHLMGLDYWGWEVDPTYFKDGCGLYQRETAQQSLFSY